MATVQAYFDGQCPLCSREISHYRKRVSPESVEFVDIAKPGFDAVALGFDPHRVQRHFHVKKDGQLCIGVDAFRAIWSIIPGYRWLGKLTGLPIVYQVSKAAYAVFARIRPLLPKRKSDCTDGQCRV